MRVSALRAFDFLTCPLTESFLVICLLMRIVTRYAKCNVSLAGFIACKFVKRKLCEVQSTDYTNKNTFWQKYQCLTLDIRDDQNAIYILLTLLCANTAIEKCN